MQDHLTKFKLHLKYINNKSKFVKVFNSKNQNNPLIFFLGSSERGSNNRPDTATGSTKPDK